MAPRTSSLIKEFNTLAEKKQQGALSSEDAQRYGLLLDVLMELGAVPTAASSFARPARIDTVLEVDFGTKEELTRAYSKNIGTGGLALKTSKVSAVGTPLEVRIKFPNTAAAVTTAGRVAWQRETEMGVEFVQLSPDAERLLKEHLVNSEGLFLSRLESAADHVDEVIGGDAVDLRALIVVRLSSQQEQEVISEVLRQGGLRVTADLTPGALVAVGDGGTALQLVAHGVLKLVFLNASGPDALVGALSRLEPSAFVRRRAPAIEVLQAVRSVLVQLGSAPP